jgi:hypothetical protein
MDQKTFQNFRSYEPTAEPEQGFDQFRGGAYVSAEMTYIRV